jgi:hypothetical protein
MTLSMFAFEKMLSAGFLQCQYAPACPRKLADEQAYAFRMSQRTIAKA